MKVEGAEPSERAPRVWAKAEEILERTGLRDNVYLRALAAGELSLDAFREGQAQFYFAVEFFSRPMAALVARIPDPRARLDILHNVVEEHGDFERGRFHETTFRAFLKSLGEEPRLEELVLWPELRAFNAVIAAACIHDELDVGIACMGIVEHAFAAISATIGRAVVGRGWVEESELVHYKLHAEIDERHAEEFYRVIEPGYADEQRRYAIEQGLELGAYCFGQLYAGLWRRARAATAAESAAGFEPRISILTLAVEDPGAELAFYRDGLGWTASTQGDWAMLHTRGVRLSLFPRAALAKDAGLDELPPAGSVTLAYNARSKEEVDALLAKAVEAGAKLVKPAQTADWGGYSGYFADPEGHLWEVAWGEGWRFGPTGELWGGPLGEPPGPR